MYKKQQEQVVSWLALTWLFGAGFIGMEIYEFHHLIMEGFGPGSQWLPVCVLPHWSVPTSARDLRSDLGWRFLMFQISRRGLTST